MTQKELSLGTTTVGIVCKDGLVLAADKRAGGGGGFIVDKKAEKVHKISDTMAVTIAGVASDAQLIIKLISAELRLLLRDLRRLWQTRSKNLEFALTL